jgi:hypothetical protein
MARTRRIMVKKLHGIADAVALDAARNERLLTNFVAVSIRKSLPEAKRPTFDAGLVRAGINGDESEFTADAVRKIEAAIAALDPDLTGIVDPKTGEVLVGKKVR